MTYNSQLITTDPEFGVSSKDSISAGQSANKAAASYLFTDYMQRRAQKTIRTQTAALVLWVEYLAQVGAADQLMPTAIKWATEQYDSDKLRSLILRAESLAIPGEVLFGGHYCQQSPEAWRGITWGLVEGFVKWLMNQGYSIASVNNRLSAVKVYARLATKAGIIPPTEHALIREVRGYGATEGKRVDRKRPFNRIGHKKEDAIVLTIEQARDLKQNHPPTQQGLRDQLMISLMLDLGLRASEVAGIKIENLSDPDHIIVYRQKTDTQDRMRLSTDLISIIARYRPYQRQQGLLLRGSRKNGKLTDQNMSVRAISNRVKLLGRDILGIWKLSPHDLRHTWATWAAKNSDPFALRDAGGWTNMQTPGRYVERSKVVNEAIELDY